MDKIFKISVEWESAVSGTPEEMATSAALRIGVGDSCATHVEDARSKSTREFIHASAYPLALWMAASWWRLRCESTFPTKNPPLSWRMAHEVAAAGYGYVWPSLKLFSDRENIHIINQVTSHSEISTLRYLDGFDETVPERVFAKEAKDFIELTLSRLHAFSIFDTELEQVWAEVVNEQKHADMSTYRMVEAQLGFDPDEAPEAFLDAFLSHADRIGSDAIFEIASACAGKDPVTNFSNAVSLSEQTAISGNIMVAEALTSTLEKSGLSGLSPWERGWTVAHAARKSWNIAKDAVSSARLAEILEIQSDCFSDASHRKRKGSVGLAIRKEDNGVAFHFSGGVETSKRFEAARFLADHLLAPISDHWLPATHAKTARQAYQRAFAAEFLCPIDPLQDFLNGDYSEEAQEDAALHFHVSPICVASNLANHGVIDPDLVPTPSPRNACHRTGAAQW